MPAKPSTLIWWMCKALATFGSQTMKGLTPEITFDGQARLLLTPQIASVPAMHYDGTGTNEKALRWQGLE